MLVSAPIPAPGSRWYKAIGVLSHTGDGVYTLVIMALLIVLGAPPIRQAVLICLAADTVVFFLVTLIKRWIRRDRPKGEWGRAIRRNDPYSFPSGHSARGGVLGIVTLGLAVWWIGLPVALWGAAVAASRVVVGIHYPSDAAAGWLLGAGVGLLTLLVAWLAF